MRVGSKTGIQGLESGLGVDASAGLLVGAAAMPKQVILHAHEAAVVARRCCCHVKAGDSACACAAVVALKLWNKRSSREVRPGI